MNEPDGLFQNKRALSYFKRIDSELAREISRRPAELRLPRKGCCFRALGPFDIDVITFLRGGDGNDLALPIEMKKGRIAKGELLHLDYEPVPSESTHVLLIPERYLDLEAEFVDAKDRKHQDYMGFGFQVSYIELDKGFEWF